MSILGREAELARIQAVLASSKQGRAARAVRIVGPTGIGKSALLAAAIEGSQPQWLTGLVTSHHIQSSLPLFAARRAVQALLDRLGSQAERYTSGLDLSREQPEVFEESFYRVIEGISLDHPILFAFDDAQWADSESRALIERSVRALADRAIVLLSTERTEDASGAAFDFRDEAIAVRELSDASSATIVREIFPEANDEVLEAIVSRAAGRAVDVVTLSEGARDQNASTAQEVDLSLRRTIARELALVDAKLREFLQICSLIDDPIEYAILRGLWPEQQVLAFIASASGRFLTERADGLHFVHDAIKQSVRETIAISIPLHRRIIAAIQALPSLRLEDYERLADQASACGDRDLQRSTLLTLGEEALKGSAHSLATSAWERALELAQPAPEEIVSFYARLSMLYNLQSREQDCIRACRFALEFARSAGITTQTAPLVTSLAIALVHSGSYSAARSELKRYGDDLVSPSDRAQLYSAEIYVAVSSGDHSNVREAQEAYAQISAHADPIVQVRVHTYNSIVASRSGDTELALESIRFAEEAARAIPMARVMPLVAATTHAFLHHGPRAIAPYLSSRSKGETGSDILDLLTLLSHVSQGEFDDARALGSELTVHHRGVIFRRLSVALRASAQAIHNPDADDPVWREILTDVAAFHTGDESTMLVPVATAWLVRESKANPRRASALLERLLSRSLIAGEPMIFHFPLLLAVSARNLKDREALRLIASDAALSVPRQPWAQAQRTLARALASAFLRTPEAPHLLTEARRLFEALEAPFFASLGERYVGNAPSLTGGTSQFGTTTRREREIAALVSEGLSNRDIAEKLVLSERTIEGHIANLFGKLDVGSRTQIAAWYLRATSSVA